MRGVLVVGWLFADLKGFAHSEYIPDGRNLGTVEIFHGGVSRNIADNIAKTGMNVTFLTVTEKGALGEDLVRRLEQDGVDMSETETVDQNGIGKWMVILDEKGSVAGQISSPPDIFPLERLADSKGERLIAEADCVIMEPDTSPALTEKIIAWCRKHNKRLYASVGNLSVISAHPEYLRSLHCFICNEIEFGKLIGQDLTEVAPNFVLDKLKEQIGVLGCSSAVITMNSKGAVYCSNLTGSSGICPARKTDVVDSTGAGDAFLSGTVMALERGFDIADAVRAGTCLASEVLKTREGSVPASEYMDTFWDSFA